MKRLFAAAAALLTLTGMQAPAPAPAPLALWRLDCGEGVPPFNTDRAGTLASMDRFDKLARNLGAKIIIQHEPADIAKLPPFPQPAQ